MNLTKILSLAALFAVGLISTTLAQTPTPPVSGSGILSDPWILDVAAGSTVILGTGNDTFYWYYNGSPIFVYGPNGYQQVFSVYYSIPNVTASQAGAYLGQTASPSGHNVYYQLNIGGGVPAMPPWSFVSMGLLILIVMAWFFFPKKTHEA